MIRLKQLRARLAAEVAQRLSPHVPGPAVHHDGEILSTVGQVQVDRTQHVEAGTRAWQARRLRAHPTVQRGQKPGLTDA